MSLYQSARGPGLTLLMRSKINLAPDRFLCLLVGDCNLAPVSFTWGSSTGDASVDLRQELEIDDAIPSDSEDSSDEEAGTGACVVYSPGWTQACMFAQQCQQS